MPSRQRRRTAPPGRGPASASGIEAILRGYVERGVFRSLSTGERSAGRVVFTIVWHHGRQFRFVADWRACAVSFPELLPPTTGHPTMTRELRTFLRQFESTAVPAHRRIDPKKGRLRVASRQSGVSVSLSVNAGQWEYCSRKLVHLAQEVYLVFLPDGPYEAYRIDQLGLDPDAVWT